MSIDEARRGIFGHDPWGRAYLNEAALDERIREIARKEIEAWEDRMVQEAFHGDLSAEDAKLSPAPVGGDGDATPFAWCRKSPSGMEELAFTSQTTGGRPAGVGWSPLYKHAPTPPAKDTEGEVWTEETLRQHAKDRGWYIREGTSVPNVHTGGYSHPFSLTVGSRELVEMLNAATSARIADLEARLAEATDLLAARADTALHWSKRAVTAERALADATKRIEALEAGPMVKPLAWVGPRPTDGDSPACDSVTMIGTYVATENGWFLSGRTGWTKAPSLKAAQLAAQTDFEARIRSALLSPASEGKTDV